MYPQQPSNDPNQGGQQPGGSYPSGQYPQDPAYQGGYQQPPYAPEAGSPAKMPGTAVTVRVLMFIGGVCGLLLGVLMWLAAAMASGDNEFSQEFQRGMEESGLRISGGEAGTLFFLVGLVPFVYGVVSVALASFMGRRSPVILWSVVVFQALAALVLILGVLSGGIGSLIPLAVTIAMIVLMLLAGTRAYYSRPAPGAY
ncbi:MULTISPECIES: proline-rich domain-containing protein [unclassified Nocardiopsis]|uniref:proline-rich domain-containing protein n=1 Tax=unclassified Nocardiopsis TaxID=2649073 RepID=UPI0019151303|nr:MULTISPECIES: proline-rich domain-containing protein [unclassified Nocardiopsis]